MIIEEDLRNRLARVLERAEKAEVERDALLERWARLKAWLDDYPGYSFVMVKSKMAELETPDAHQD